jgi:hypothetical protein
VLHVRPSLWAGGRQKRVLARGVKGRAQANWGPASGAPPGLAVPNSVVVENWALGVGNWWVSWKRPCSVSRTASETDGGALQWPIRVAMAAAGQQHASSSKRVAVELGRPVKDCAQGSTAPGLAREYTPWGTWAVEHRFEGGRGALSLLGGVARVPGSEFYSRAVVYACDRTPQ